VAARDRTIWWANFTHAMRHPAWRLVYIHIHRQPRRYTLVPLTPQGTVSRRSPWKDGHPR